MKRKLRWMLLGSLALLTAASLWGPRWQAQETSGGNARPSSGVRPTAGPNSSAAINPAIRQNPDTSEGRQTARPPPSASTEIDEFSEPVDPTVDSSITAPEAPAQDTGEFLDPDAESPATPSEDETILDTGPYIDADVPAN